MPSTHPPPSLSPPKIEHGDVFDDASEPSERPVIRVRASALMVPPPPDGDDIPAWHLGSGLKPLRPLPRDLAVHMRRKSLTPFRVRAAETPDPPAPRRIRARDVSHIQTTSPPARRRRPPSWTTRVIALLLGAVLVGAIAGSVSERVVHHFAPPR